MKSLILLFLLFCSCATNLTAISKYGAVIQIRDAQVTPEQIDNIIEMTSNELLISRIYSERQLNDALPNLKKYIIEFVPNEIGACQNNRTCEGFKCKYGWCSGLWKFYKTGAITIADHNCLGDSSLPHELFHFFNWHIDKFNDKQHINYKLFIWGCYLKYPRIKNDQTGYDRWQCIQQSLEFILADKIIKKYCHRFIRREIL